jgi:hypothetical protein
VLCVSCELFYSGGAGEQLEQMAQLVRQRLAETSREFGLKLPVYVLFTKADRIPHYEAWAATFTRDEVRAPLGGAAVRCGRCGRCARRTPHPARVGGVRRDHAIARAAPARIAGARSGG